MPPLCYHYMNRLQNRLQTISFLSSYPSLFMSPLSLSKNWSSLLLPFIAGAIIAALAFSLFGGGSGSADQSGASDLQGNVRSGTPQIVPGIGGAACNTTNCQLMAKLNQMHGNGGNSTWSLDAIGYYNGQNFSYIQNAIHDVQGWNVNDNLSSWSLESLAIQNFDMFENTVAMIKNNGMGPSSWTLQALASQISNVCQN